MVKSKSAVLVGLLGTKLQFSRAPELHMQEGDRCGLRYVYRLIDLESLGLEDEALPSLLHAAEQLGFNGLAVTHPYKEAVAPHLAELTDEARMLGAVNTIVFQRGRSIGHNTDWLGFSQAFQRDMAGAKMDRAVLLGAGGAGKAVAHALLSSGVKHVAVSVRDPRKVWPALRELASHHGADRISIAKDLKEAVSSADGVVNATPVGMDAYPGTPLPRGLLRSDLWVADLIYSPAETELLRNARAVGARTTNGLGMLIFQAAEQFRLFTGIEPDARRMLEHPTEHLAVPDDVKPKG